MQPNDTVMARATSTGTIEIKVVPTLILAELPQRHGIEGPIDESADREQWQAEAAHEALGFPDA